MKRLLLLWLVLYSLGGQLAWSQTGNSPYHVNWLRDGAITAGAVGASVIGSLLITNKEKLTEADLAGLSNEDVNGFDRFAAGNYSANAEHTSDYFFYGSFATPFLLLLNDNVRQDAPQVFMLYGQAMSIAGGMYSLTAGLIDRKRPSVYASDAPLDARLHKYGENSFYAGHTSATAAATFFVAKVFHDLNPGSPARPYIWAAAAAVPATVGYLRLRAGKHFLSDNILGYAIGASVGILVPELHKRGSKVSLLPVSSADQDGVALVYTF
ncbi:phosphatase PAP2 family protein [Pontibacter toksunensis]|uniref:Phosphatase PAP2 family protein n=1 Tax=Pontibacter toksunensis TaxID=1332631 RepID=A0ABW6BVY0_9BACT